MALHNTGYYQKEILEGYYLDDLSVDGIKMPNIAQISPQAIVPESATITYNYPNDAIPTGGIDGDIWYNPQGDNLYKKIGGFWDELTDRVTNSYYVAPVINLDACPL